MAPVKDFADYFTKKSSENIETLESVIGIVPVGRKDIKMLLKLVLGREQDVEIMADVLRHQSQIMQDRG